VRKKSPFTPGRDHFHHTLKRGGMGFKRSLGMLAGLQAFYAFVGLVGHFAHVPDAAMFISWSVLGLSQRFIIKLGATHHRNFVRRRRRAMVP
jgi:UDP-GlcNAc:undecaprenyl-phosphate GlcNAc-1-phosphate transferase